MKPDYLKLIFWILGVMTVLMTGIGGSAASHLVGQVDVLSTQVSSMQVQLAESEEARRNTERRLLSIEDKLDFIRTKQTLQTEK